MDAPLQPADGECKAPSAFTTTQSSAASMITVSPAVVDYRASGTGEASATATFDVAATAKHFRVVYDYSIEYAGSWDITGASFVDLVGVVYGTNVATDPLVRATFGDGNVVELNSFPNGDGKPKTSDDDTGPVRSAASGKMTLEVSFASDGIASFSLEGAPSTAHYAGDTAPSTARPTGKLTVVLGGGAGDGDVPAVEVRFTKVCVTTLP